MFRWAFYLIVFEFFIIFILLNADDKLRSCNELTFCTRGQKFYLYHNSSKYFYYIEKDSIQILDNKFTASLKHSLMNTSTLEINIFSFYLGAVRILIKEIKSSNSTKYNVFEKDFILKENLNGSVMKNIYQNQTCIILEFMQDKKAINKKSQSEEKRINVNLNPFFISIENDDGTHSIFNGNGILNYEIHRNLSEQLDIFSNYEIDSTFYFENGTDFNNTFQEDNIEGNPTSIGIGIYFTGNIRFFGLPLRALNLPLQKSGIRDMYRIYNVDLYKHQIGSKINIYGSIPLIISYNNQKGLSGLLWLNAADTFVSLENEETYWMSESGNIDVIMWDSFDFHKFYEIYTKITGKAELPPFFSFGYHQSRYSYLDQSEVLNIEEEFDKRDIPIDAIWIDIDHTISYQYFTWNEEKFPNVMEMMNILDKKGRKAVRIFDPHIKVDHDYFVFKENARCENMSYCFSDYFVKSISGETYFGKCWPGQSAYLDFLNPKVRDYWANLIDIHTQITNKIKIHAWNDMNEPSVFDVTDHSLPKSTIHFDEKGDKYYHKDIHNSYGFLVTQSTKQGMTKNQENNLRPFILSRSFFIGSQRLSAVWTGDNTANWEFLKFSIPMILSLSISGISFVGSDIPGYTFNNPEDLAISWFNLGSFYPFFRGHTEKGNIRKEPWSWGDKAEEKIKEFIRRRYSLLFYIYNEFYKHTIDGFPLLRPMWLIYHNTESCYYLDIDNQMLFGDSLMIGIDNNQNYMMTFPEEDIWYDLPSGKRITIPGCQIDIKSLNIEGPFIRGGSIINRVFRYRRSSKFLIKEKLTMTIYLDKNQRANGTQFIDDGFSNLYKSASSKYLLSKFEFEKNKLMITCLHNKNDFNNEIERIILYRLSDINRFKQVIVNGKQAYFRKNENSIIVKSPQISICSNSSLLLNY